MPEIYNNKDNKEDMKSIFKQFKDVTKNPETFLSKQLRKSQQAKNLLKEIYDISVKNAASDEHCDMVLPELVLEDMDEEQIWQQIEIRNNFIWPKFLEKISKFLAMKDEGFHLNCADENSISESCKEVKDNCNNMTDYFKSDGEEDEDNELENEISIEKSNKNKKIKSTVVDDKFFKLAEMEEFLIQEDRKEELRQKGKLDESDDSIDYFGNISDEDEENVKYLRFFDNEEGINQQKTKHSLKKRKGSLDSDASQLSDKNESEEDEIQLEGTEKDSENSFSDEEDENDLSGDGLSGEEDKLGSEEEELEEEDEDDVKESDRNQKQYEGYSTDESDNDDDKKQKLLDEKSSFEQKQERLRKRIEEYEENILQEKPWQLKGEITATSRPQNSLLEEILEFDAATRPAPVITEETTLRLEDIIKQRIKDKAWDDVERKYKPIQTPQEFRKKLVLDQEKSKESLAQIYEKEYHAQLEKLNPDNQNTTEEEPKQHKQIRELMKSLFIKLDALSNFHYTPKPVAPEPRIITNTPALNMEEVAPVSVSDANLLAPEEIKNRPKGDLLGKTERQKTDKKRERRKKKLHQKAMYKRQEEKEATRQQLGLKPTKKEEKDKNLRNVIKHRNVQKANVSSELTSTYKSSKSFFSSLQDRTTSILKRKGEKPKKEGITAKKMKL